MEKAIDLPLMMDNITRGDLDELIRYLQQDQPRLTQGEQVRAFEREWSEWLGTKYSVFVNSGSSANLLTMTALKHLRGEGEVIVPALTWVSDIASVMQSGLTPRFVDIDPRTLGMNEKQVLNALTDKTRAVFLTHILGFNGLSSRLIEELEKRNIPLIEDVCESHGATFQGKRLGSIGYASNFSFYFAHHMSTIEGGMVSTNDERFYNVVKILRSHGMTRELDSAEMKAEYFKNYPDLNPDFIFAYPGYNMRSTELNAVIGRRQLKSLDTNNEKRVENCRRFYDQLDKAKFRTDFEFEGSVNYAFVLVLRDPDQGLMDRLCARLKECNVEFRRGTSGGGNQLRQPYLKGAYKDRLHEFPEVDHLHFFGMYIGNYPTLETSKIDLLCRAINSI